MAGTMPSAATVSSSSGTVARAARSGCFLPLPRGGRGRRGGRDDFLALLALDRSLGIMAGMDQKDFFALIVVYGSCMVKAGFTGFVTPRALLLAGPRCSASWSRWTRRFTGRQRSSSALAVACICLVLLDSSPRAEFPFLVCRPRCSASWAV